MVKAKNILLLAGSAEARQIAQGLKDRGERVVALMSEAPRGVNPMPVPFDVVAQKLRARIVEAVQAADLVIDASHGFDARMTVLGAQVAQQAGRPFVTLTRPAWALNEHPLWQGAPDVAQAMPLIPPGTRVFAATGWPSLPCFEGFAGDCLLLRQTLAHDRAPPFDFVKLIFGEAPFDAEGEMALFEELAVDIVMCRNLGGGPSRPKLEAAKALGLPVILIDRPVKPTGLETVATAQGALAWVAGR